MAAPVYKTDLIDVYDFEGTTPGVEITGYLQGGTISVEEADFFVQGSFCYSAPNNRKSGLQSIGVPVTAFTLNTLDCVFMWQVELAGNAMETFAAGGLRVAVGTDVDNYRIWYTGGKDFGRNPLGGWQNVVVWPSYTPTDDNLGSVTTNTLVASCLNMVAVIDKGNPHGVDATRKGRGEIMYWSGDAANGYATFISGASTNDLQANKWGLLAKEGTGYLWKGKQSFGKDASVVDFRDANRYITIDNTARTYTGFNALEVNNVNSYVQWTNISFTALSPTQLSRGSFKMNADASVLWDTCIMTDMSTFEFSSRCKIYDSTFRRTAHIDQSTALFDGCVFDNCTDSVTIYSNNPQNISNCEFRSDGGNHALYLGPETSGGSYNFLGNSFTNYATDNGVTGNEVIWNNSGGLVVINYAGGSGTITVRDTGDSSTTVASSVTLTLTVSGEDQLPIAGAKAYIDDPTNTAPFIMNTLTNGSGVATVGWSGGPVAGAYWRVRLYGYKPFLAISAIGSVDKEIPVTLVKDPQQY